MITTPTITLPASAQGAAANVSAMPKVASPFSSLSTTKPGSAPASVLAPKVAITKNPYRGPMFHSAPPPAVPSAPVAPAATRIPVWVYIAGAGLAVWLLIRRAR